jgi:murein DD-endopeptidase MepM/ murein hydrolase activator NlpD
MSDRPLKGVRVAAVALALALASSSCGTPTRAQKNGRLGILDQLGKLDAAGGRGHREHSQDGSDEVSTATLERVRQMAAEWRWPVKQVQITSPYGPRKKEFHDGIDLRADPGTSVHAVGNGRVIYAGKRLRGYGLMVVIRHTHEVSTLYAHNSKVLVREGQEVRRGQRIALSGSTGRTRGPHLHFEVRSGVAALDPQWLMPSPRLASAAEPENEARALAGATPTRRQARR